MKYKGNRYIIEISTIIFDYYSKEKYGFIQGCLYHEFVHIFEMSHDERFFKVFEDKLKDGPSLDDEFKKIKLVEYL